MAVGTLSNFEFDNICQQICYQLSTPKDNSGYKVLEYHPAPWDQWLEVGHLEEGRRHHAVHSIGYQDLPCLLGL